MALLPAYLQSVERQLRSSPRGDQAVSAAGEAAAEFEDFDAPRGDSRSPPAVTRGAVRGGESEDDEKQQQQRHTDLGEGEGGGGGGGGGRGGGGGEAPKDYTKPRQTIQSAKKTIQSPRILDKTLEY